MANNNINIKFSSPCGMIGYKTRNASQGTTKTCHVFPSPYGENYSLTLASENRINTGSPRLFAAEKKKLIIFRSFFCFSRKSVINVCIAHIISWYSDIFHDKTGTHLVKSTIVWM